MAQLIRFHDAAAQIAAVTDIVARRLEMALAARGETSLVCSGGTTPAPLYDALSRRPLDWSRVQVTGSDERWLEPSDPGSIDHLLHVHLIKDHAAQARFVPLKTGDAEPEAAEAEVHARIKAMPRPFTVTLLGMGADGHTASLYPGAPGLAKALDIDDPALVRAVRPVEAAGSSLRMSLTLRALLDSELIVVFFRGEEKLKVYEAALVNPDPNLLPVSAILRQASTPVQACWAP
jgi:6-phosphogluconolactonase